MSMRNLVAMFGAMALLRRIDQEEPIVLLYARVGYLLYAGLTAVMYILLHFRIVARRDTTLITVPISAKAPSFTEAMEQARKATEKAEADKHSQSEDSESTASIVADDRQANQQSNGAVDNSAESSDNNKDEHEKTETITVMEYDLRHLANARRSWVTSSCFLAAVHYHMQSVSPLVMSAVMGSIRLLTEDQLVQIHLRGIPAVDKLARPFSAEKNPLANMLKEFSPKDERPAQDNTERATRPEEELYDDGDDEDEDEELVAITDMKDDHIKSDFDEEETSEVSAEAKKSK